MSERPNTYNEELDNWDQDFFSDRAGELMLVRPHNGWSLTFGTFLGFEERRAYVRDVFNLQRVPLDEGTFVFVNPGGKYRSKSYSEHAVSDLSFGKRAIISALGTRFADSRSVADLINSLPNEPVEEGQFHEKRGELRRDRTYQKVVKNSPIPDDELVMAETSEKFVLGRARDREHSLLLVKAVKLSPSQFRGRLIPSFGRISGDHGLYSHESYQGMNPFALYVGKRSIVNRLGRDGSLVLRKYVPFVRGLPEPERV